MVQMAVAALKAKGGASKRRRNKAESDSILPFPPSTVSCIAPYFMAEIIFAFRLYLSRRHLPRLAQHNNQSQYTRHNPHSL